MYKKKTITKIKDYLFLIRIKQWYKNLIIFLAIFFVGQLFDPQKFFLVFVGFLSLCFISSTNYIINDLIDLKKDKLHPEKKKRPLASKKIKKGPALILSIIFLFLSLGLAWEISLPFFYSVLLLFFLSQLYSFFLKKVLFADILTIAVLFVIRAIAGAAILGVKVSPWLIFCPFFLSLFLSTGKRHGDLCLLKKNLFSTRKVLKEYNRQLTSSLMIISTTLLVISYTLYSFFSEHPRLFYTLPFALFTIFRYFYLIYSNSIIARHPEKVIQDKQLLLGIAFWVLTTLIIIY